MLGVVLIIRYKSVKIVAKGICRCHVNFQSSHSYSTANAINWLVWKVWKEAEMFLKSDSDSQSVAKAGFLKKWAAKRMKNTCKKQFLIQFNFKFKLKSYFLYFLRYNLGTWNAIKRNEMYGVGRLSIRTRWC